MITWIGLCAGEVWKYLDSHNGECFLKNLLKDIDSPKETIFMALGWLAREGYVFLEGDVSNFKIRLNSNPPKK